MKRREFITLLGGTAAAWPLAARAQQPAMPVVGFLFTGFPAASFSSSFSKGLSEMGFVDGRNLAIEYRWAEDRRDRLPALAAELARRKVAAIYAGGGTLSVAAAKAATTTIPIVFSIGDDPVQAGLVASFNRPERNVTGISFMNAQLTAKRIGLLHELLLAAERFAMLVDPGNQRAAAAVTADARAAAAAIGRQIDVFTASTNGEIDAAFATIVQERADALLIGPSPLFLNRRAQIATLAARHALPAIHFSRAFAEASGLMSYGSSIADAVRQAGIYVGRILRGEKPADLPVQQAVKFEFVINLQTARALGLTVPPTLLARADEVIE
jgi:putative tryptophan/tyrosine transport system substrate-binding protein